jgi:hypothetical protein
MKSSSFLSVVGLILSCALFSFGQERVVSAVSSDNFVTSNNNGIYFFEVPTDISANDVALSAEYYTMYFIVAFNEKNHQAVITLKDMSDNSKHVIARFFVALGLREVKYNGSIYSVEDFYQKFLRAK